MGVRCAILSAFILVHVEAALRTVRGARLDRSVLPRACAYPPPRRHPACVCTPCPHPAPAQICSAGRYSTPDNPVCRQCPPGKFSSLVTSLVRPGAGCLFCPMGQYSNSRNVKCGERCDSGSFQSGPHCIECAPGKYLVAPLMRIGRQSHPCDVCPRGKFQNGHGKLFCYDCAFGQFSFATGARSCNQRNGDEIAHKKTRKPAIVPAPHLTARQAHRAAAKVPPRAVVDIYAPAPTPQPTTAASTSTDLKSAALQWVHKNAPMAAAGAMFGLGALLSVCNNFAVGKAPKEYQTLGAPPEGEMTSLSH